MPIKPWELAGEITEIIAREAGADEHALTLLEIGRIRNAIATRLHELHKETFREARRCDD